MQLYRAFRDNGASEPWNLENEWCFSVELYWNDWAIGLARWMYDGAVWTVRLGPISINYYRKQ